MPTFWSMDETFSSQIATPRFHLGLLGIFAGMALLLASVACAASFRIRLRGAAARRATRIDPVTALRCE